MARLKRLFLRRRRCSNCYHYRRPYCACREVVDMADPCFDWQAQRD